MTSSRRPYGVSDFPLAETHPTDVKTANGRPLADITLDAVEAGDFSLSDIRITPRTLLDQAEIARAAGRATLAANFERAAELVDIPQALMLEIYELLRPGRAAEKGVLLDAAKRLRADFGAQQTASFIEEAAAAYERRGLFKSRY